MESVGRTKIACRRCDAGEPGAQVHGAGKRASAADAGRRSARRSDPKHGFQGRQDHRVGEGGKSRVGMQKTNASRALPRPGVHLQRAPRAPRSPGRKARARAPACRRRCRRPPRDLVAAPRSGSSPCRAAAMPAPRSAPGRHGKSDQPRIHACSFSTCRSSASGACAFRHRRPRTCWPRRASDRYGCAENLLFSRGRASCGDELHIRSPACSRRGAPRMRPARTVSTFTMPRATPSAIARSSSSMPNPIPRAEHSVPSPRSRSPHARPLGIGERRPRDRRVVGTEFSEAAEERH